MFLFFVDEMDYWVNNFCSVLSIYLSNFSIEVLILWNTWLKSPVSFLTRFIPLSFFEILLLLFIEESF